MVYRYAMPDDPYTIGDLSRLADVTPRTVRYYLAQGLLPSPEAAGPATRYGEAHLARLRLIKRLQRDHLPLAEIRLRLERLRDDEVIATVSALEARTPEPATDANDTLAFVRGLMARSGIPPTTSGGAQGLALTTTSGATLEEAWATHPPVPASMPAPAPAVSGAPAQSRARRMVQFEAVAPDGPLAGPEAQRVAPDRSTWERLVISPDVELHVRRPLDRRSNKRVDQLERIARELFEDD
jgi:DNA-binding transcriptional MerR regulator